MAAVAITIGVILDVRGRFLLNFPDDDELSGWIFFKRISFSKMFLSYFLCKDALHFLTKIFYKIIIL